jgi:hypothetical protein
MDRSPKELPMKSPLLKRLSWVAVVVAVLSAFPHSAAAQGCDGSWCAEVVFSCWRCVGAGTGDPNMGCLQISGCWCENLACSLPSAARAEPAKSAQAMLGFVPSETAVSRCSE